MDRIASIAQKTFAPELVRRALESLSESSVRAAEHIDTCPESYLADLGKLFVVSFPMLDTLRAYPEYIGWLNS